MGRTELIVNNGYDRSEKSVLSTGKHRKLLVKNQLTYSEKLHEMPKESSFRSSSTSSSSETEEETKSSRLQNRCGEFPPFL